MKMIYRRWAIHLCGQNSIEPDILCRVQNMNGVMYEWSNGNLSSNRQSNLGPHFCNLVGLLFYYGQNQDMMFKTSKGMTEKFVCSYGKEFMYENN